MKVIAARNINGIWDQAKDILRVHHVVRPSRVGEVWECPEIVSTEYFRPTERVLFNPLRNANPVFHLMESLWMLAGRQDVAWIETFNSKIRDYVGKADIMHDAYGHRLRFAFDLDGGAEDGYADQFAKVIRMLKKSPDERRAVLCMWNPIWDLERPDLPSVPCNLVATAKIRDGKLNLAVFCRSNDICMGAYGANVVHFSIFQEYLAAMIGVPVGVYTQISDSWHAYTARWDAMGGNDTTPTPDYYSNAYQYPCKPYPLVADPDTFDVELLAWMARVWGDDKPIPVFDNSFFNDVAEPLWQTWKLYRNNDLVGAQLQVAECEATDWQVATVQWLQRIIDRRKGAPGL